MTPETGAVPDAGEFAERTEPYRRELLTHCYRLLGSADEAEDLVQETYLRAWRSFATFEGRASLRVWLYRIATNACLTAIEHRGRSASPSGLAGPAGDPGTAPAPAPAGPDAWPQIPDALVTRESDDPAVIVTARESLRLALMVSLRYLPARQRAVFLLREVLGFPAAEVAAMLGMSVAAVKSALQRARSRLDEAAPPLEQITEPTDPHSRALLEQYITGFQNADTAALERALRTDAAIELAGTPTWFSGRVNCLRFLTHVIGSPGNWRMIPASADGRPAAAAYLRDDDGIHRAWGLGVLTVTTTGIARITVLDGGHDLLARYGLPSVHPSTRPPAPAACEAG